MKWATQWNIAVRTLYIRRTVVCRLLSRCHPIALLLIQVEIETLAQFVVLRIGLLDLV